MKEGATGASTLEEFKDKLVTPRVAWIMIPAGITGKTVDQLAELFEDGDMIIDGGNSNYRDDIHRADALRPKGIHYIDIGTSGGVFGLERGYCLMIGGDTDAVAAHRPVAQDDRPGRRDGSRGRRARPASRRRPSRATCTADRTVPVTS